MNRSFAKIVPSRLMVVGLGTTLLILCGTAIFLLRPGLVGRERLADRLVEGLLSVEALQSENLQSESLDRILFVILQSNKVNRNISYLRFVDLESGSIFTFDENESRQLIARSKIDVWARLRDENDGKAIKIEGGSYDIFQTLSLDPGIAINLGIDPELAHEIEAQRRLSVIVGSIILATGLGILIMIWQTRQIEEAKGELELVLANTLEPVLMVDNYCRLVFANEPARTLLGHPKGKKLKNRHLLSLTRNPDTHEFFSKMLSDERSDMNEFETLLPGFSEKTTFRAAMMDVETAVGRTFGKLLVLRDITLEKRLEDKKVSQTIHELKGMLGEVKGFIRQALETMEGESQRDQRAFLNICLDKLEKSYNTVAAMVRSIVSAFKPHSLQLRLRHCDLDEIIKSNVDDFRASFEKEQEKGLDIKLEIPDGLPTVCCDNNALSRVIVNLLINAQQHCPDGSITLTAEEKDEMVQVSVRDTGTGIPRENLKRIFEPNVSFRKEGSGLGLSICRDFIRAHGGDIWAESAGRGKGSVFSFTLPKSKPVILVSDPALAERLETECVKRGYFPVILDDLLAATRKVGEINPNAILLDIDMEDTISGISLAYRLKKTPDTARIPIIAFASNLEEAQAELDRYEDITLEAFLQKDFNDNNLGSAIRTVEAYWYLAQSL